jgi:hypothetical protein
MIVEGREGTNASPAVWPGSELPTPAGHHFAYSIAYASGESSARKPALIFHQTPVSYRPRVMAVLTRLVASRANHQSLQGLYTP